MHKHKVVRAPLIAVLGLLAFLVVPAAAQAHHITAEASCKLVGGQPTAELKVTFVGFSTSARPTVRGKVWLDGVNGSERSWTNAAPPLTWNSSGNATLTTTWDVAGDQSYTAKASFTWQSGGNGSASLSTGKCPKPPAPSMTIVKDGPSTRYVGDQATFTYTVTNTGGATLPNPVVTDDKCAPVTKIPDGQNSFDAGDVWKYTCTTTITDAMGDRLVNTACAEVPGKKVCDTHTTDIPKPAIALDKTGVATANAGDTVGYEFAATNTGNVTLGNVALTDDKCQSTLVRKAGETDTVFNPGDVWNYTCTAVVPSGVTTLRNVADVCGTYTPPTGPPTGVNPKTVCDEDDHEFPVPPPTNPPTDNPPSDTPPADTPPSSTPNPPSGGVLPEEIASGIARLRGPSGCVDQAFRARVSGRSIAAVTFSVDGRVVKQFNTRKRSYSVRINPQRLGFGRHRVIARVRFVKASGTAARSLPLTFRRCAQGAVAPRFTG